MLLAVTGLLPDGSIPNQTYGCDAKTNCFQALSEKPFTLKTTRDSGFLTVRYAKVNLSFPLSHVERKYVGSK